MKRIIITVAFALLASSAHAEVYKWEDEIGMHFTENLGSVPAKYRNQAVDNAREDISIRNPDVARSVARDNAENSRRDQQEAREEAVREQQRAQNRQQAAALAARRAQRQELARQAAASVEAARQVAARQYDPRANSPLKTGSSLPYGLSKENFSEPVVTTTRTTSYDAPPSPPDNIPAIYQRTYDGSGNLINARTGERLNNNYGGGYTGSSDGTQYRPTGTGSLLNTRTGTVSPVNR